MKIKIILATLILSVSLQAKPIKVLLITGHTISKYHSWKTKSNYCKAILDRQGIFETDVVIMKDNTALDESFAPDFSAILPHKAPTCDWTSPATTGVLQKC